MAGDKTLGIDIGGTKILVGLLDQSIQLSEISRFSTVQGDAKGNLAILSAIFEDPRYKDIAVVGISVPTTVAPDGKLRDDYGFTGLGGLQLGALFSNEKRAVRVYPDVECGAAAEARWGSGKGCDHILYITIGTGLAHCLVVGGTPNRGATGSGFFSGYMAPARCADPGCRADDVESICAGPGIALAYGSGRKAEVVFEHAAKGDQRAISIIGHASWHMAAMMADLIHVFNPGLIILGGGLGSGSAYYREQIIRLCRPLIKPEECKQVPIVAAALNEYSCLVGAAGLANT